MKNAIDQLILVLRLILALLNLLKFLLDIFGWR